MAEYIERDAIYGKISELEELARNRVVDTPSISPAYARYVSQLNERTALKHMIFDTPAADVVPVVHGRWVNRKVHGINYRICSVCGEYRPALNEFGKVAKRSYRPNCGAKIDMEQE